MSVGDKFLVEQEQRTKSIPAYDCNPYDVIEVKGTMITARKNDDVIKRDISFFKRMERPPSIDDWFMERIKSTQKKEVNIDPFPDAIVGRTAAVDKHASRSNQKESTGP